MTNQLTFRAFQALLVDNGFPMPQFGADGFYGAETARAVEAWGKSGKSLVFDKPPLPPPPPPPPSHTIVPREWMPACDMERIIIHWTAGGAEASVHDRTFYHILVERSGKLVRGTRTIKDNVSSADGVYAGHTRDLNTRSIGICACGMAGAVERPFNPGMSPISESQWLVLAHVAADLADFYDIPIDRKHVLSHGEVQDTLGVQQNGKWDINVLPWAPALNKTQANDLFRLEASRFQP